MLLWHCVMSTSGFVLQSTPRSTLRSTPRFTLFQTITLKFTFRYLDTYEKVNFHGEDPERAEFDIDENSSTDGFH